MASGLSGDFVADGEVNLFDLSLQLRLLYGWIDVASHYMRVADTASWAVRTAQECSRRRELLASRLKSWTVECPQTISSSCYYDCIEDEACKVSFEPQPIRTLAQGSWFSVPVPAPWVGLSLLFTGSIKQCVVVNCNLPASFFLGQLTQAEIDAQCSPANGIHHAWFADSCIHMEVDSSCDT